MFPRPWLSHPQVGGSRHLLRTPTAPRHTRAPPVPEGSGRRRGAVRLLPRRCAAPAGRQPRTPSLQTETRAAGPTRATDQRRLPAVPRTRRSSPGGTAQGARASRRDARRALRPLSPSARASPSAAPLATRRQAGRLGSRSDAMALRGGSAACACAGRARVRGACVRARARGTSVRDRGGLGAGPGPRRAHAPSSCPPPSPAAVWLPHLIPYRGRGQ